MSDSSPSQPFATDVCPYPPPGVFGTFWDKMGHFRAADKGPSLIEYQRCPRI